MARKKRSQTRRTRRRFDDDLKEEAVRMLLDGHAASSVASNLGLSSTSLLYRWKKERLKKGGVAASTLEARVRDLEEQLRTVERERDILKKALSIFSQRG